MEEAKQICMETSLRAEQTLATATAHVHVDMRAWETSERVQQQRRKLLTFSGVVLPCRAWITRFHSRWVVCRRAPATKSALCVPSIPAGGACMREKRC